MVYKNRISTQQNSRELIALNRNVCASLLSKVAYFNLLIFSLFIALHTFIHSIEQCAIVKLRHW